MRNSHTVRALEATPSREIFRLLKAIDDTVMNDRMPMGLGADILQLVDEVRARFT